MDVSGYRNNFLIYIVDDEVSIQEVVKEALKDAGYQTATFSSAEEAFEGLKSQPPHVIISDIRMGGMSGIDLLKKVREVSQDIQFIIMTSHASLETALEAIRLGAYDYIHKPFEQIEDVIKCIDRTVEKLYLQFQNEQLMAELDEKNKALVKFNSQITQEKEEVVKLNRLMQVLSQAKSVDDVIQGYLVHTSQVIENKPILFMTHLQSYLSLLVTHVVGYDKEALKNVGVSLKEIDSKDYIQLLMDPMKLKPLQEMVKNVFKVDKYLAFPIQEENNIGGIVVILDDVSDVPTRRLVDSFSQIFRVSYQNSKMQKRIHDMAIKDPLTGLYNRRYFNEKLEEEIARSRRTKLPVSLIFMDIDHFKKYNDQNGHPMGDVLLKMYAQILKKTSRKNDIVARIGGEEFVIILPHTDKMGAAIKAEKLRRLIEATPFPHGEKQPLGKISSSFGVSEYPAHSHDAEGLVKAADDALYQVKSTTRNKVCLATVDESFKPDFEAVQVPTQERKS